MGIRRVRHDVSLGGGRIYGVLDLPTDPAGSPLPGPRPLVVCSHFFGGTQRNSGEWADRFAGAGLVSYAFDFRGGSPQSRSSGRTTDMTVGAEVGDLCAVLGDLATLPEVDAGNVFLCGQSQGGVVSALAAARQLVAFVREHARG